MNRQVKIRLLHRYILREFLPPFGVGLLVFTFVLILHHLFLMMDLFLNRGVDLWTVLKMAGLILPMFLPLSIPMAALLAALVCYGRLTEDGELTALKSGGCALSQYSFPNVLFGVVLSLFLVYFNLYAAPRSTQAFKVMNFTVAQRNPLALFAPRVMNQFGDYKIIVDTLDRRKKKLTSVSIYHMNPSGAPTRILAPEGLFKPDPDGSLTIELVNGALHQPNPNQENEYTITTFNKFSLRIPAKVDDEQLPPPTPREMDLDQLRAKIAEARKAKAGVAPLETESNLRVAIAFAPAVFIILGVALGILFRRGSKSVGVSLSLVILLAYYGLFIFAVSLSSQGVLPPVVLTWIPNLIALAVGTAVWRRVASQ